MAAKRRRTGARGEEPRPSVRCTRVLARSRRMGRQDCRVAAMSVAGRIPANLTTDVPGRRCRAAAYVVVVRRRNLQPFFIRANFYGSPARPGMAGGETLWMSSTVSTASAQTAATHRGPRPRRAGAAATHWVSSTTRHRGCPGCPRLRRHRGCPRSRCSTLFVYPPELQTLATSVLENSGCPRSCPKLLGVSEASKALLVGYPSFPVLFPRKRLKRSSLGVPASPPLWVSQLPPSFPASFPQLPETSWLSRQSIPKCAPPPLVGCPEAMPPTPKRSGPRCPAYTQSLHPFHIFDTLSGSLCRSPDLYKDPFAIRMMFQ